MPINFVTGLPRHGKTLWTIVTVRERAEREKRKVYYCNIPGVTIDGWEQIDHPDKWLELEDGAIIIVDELQDFWDKQPIGSRSPPPILELSKHGKRGFDFYFITQEPNLVHSTPRDLCAHHYYVVRAFGTNSAKVYKFERIQLHPEKVKSKGESIPFIYPKKAFAWYKSADVHNIKRQIPWKVWAIPIMAILAGLMIWTAYKLLTGTVGKAAGSGQAGLDLGSMVPGVPGSNVATPVRPQPGAPGQARPSGPMTTSEYLASYTPRIADLPHTAPAYDGITTPQEAPFPAACVKSATRCQCYSQQGTRLPVSAEMCAQVVERGMFIPWARPSQPHQAPPPRPHEGPVARQAGSEGLRF